MGNDGVIDSGGLDALFVRPDGRGSGMVGVYGHEVGVENVRVRSKVVEGAKGTRLHQDSSAARLCGRRGTSYRGCWTVRLHTGEAEASFVPSVPIMPPGD